jgi:hypothetical protein
MGERSQSSLSPYRALLQSVDTTRNPDEQFGIFSWVSYGVVCQENVMGPLGPTRKAEAAIGDQARLTAASASEFLL